MAKRLPYPYRCPRCASVKHVDMVESDHEDDTYTEDWQCDGCGTSWRATFVLEALVITEGGEDDEDLSAADESEY